MLGGVALAVLRGVVARKRLNQPSVMTSSIAAASNSRMTAARCSSDVVPFSRASA